MTIEENQEIVRRFDRLFNARGFDACPAMFAPNFVSHRATGDVTREEVIATNPALCAAFPDIELHIDWIVSEGDRVAYQET